MKNSLTAFLMTLIFVAAGHPAFAQKTAEEKIKNTEDNFFEDSVTADEDTEEDPFNPATTVKDKKVETLKVTGSRITRIDTTGVSPLVTYNKEDLENAGYSSAGDFLRDTTAFHFGVSREEAGRSTSGESFAGIKGEKSLILINGVRVAEDSSGSGQVDLNLIPIFAIERVEILKDGASALYGSDAVGGVINFITKKDFSGVELHAQAAPTIYKGGSRGDIAAVFGAGNNKGSFIGSLHFRFQDSIENFERKWTDKTISPVGPYGIFNGQVDPKCPSDLKTSGGCNFNVADHSTRYPQYGQLYGYFQGDYKLKNTMTLYSQLIASSKNNKWSYAPVPGSLKIPSGHKMSFATGQAGDLTYRFMEAGKRDTTYNNFIGDLTLGIKGYLSPTWDYDFSVKMAHTKKNSEEGGLLLKEELTRAIMNGTYDPFDSSKRDLSKALYTVKSKDDSTLLLSSLDFSGEAGFIDLATGVQAYVKSYRNKADEKAKTGKNSVQCGKRRFRKTLCCFKLPGRNYTFFFLKRWSFS